MSASGSSGIEVCEIDDLETEMDTQTGDDSEMKMETADTIEPSLQKRRNTWPGSLQTPKTIKTLEDVEDAEDDGEKSAAAAEGSSSSARKPSMRRNAWGNMSYAEMITNAIESAPEKRMTLAQIYDWIVKNVPYFQDKGDNSSSASWKNSVRHNLSLHSQFTKLQNEGTGKSSWWVVKADAVVQRRRARTMESGVFDRKRGKGKLKAPGITSNAAFSSDENLPGHRCRSGSTASSLGRLSPIQAETELEQAAGQWDQPASLSTQGSSQFLIPGSQGGLVSEPVTNFVSGSTWPNFALTLNEQTPLVATATGPTTVLFVDQPVQVSASNLQDNKSANMQAPMIVLLTSPQTAVTQYIPSSASGLAIPASSLPSSNISCVTLSGLDAIPKSNVCPPVVAQKQLITTSSVTNSVLINVPPKVPAPSVPISNANPGVSKSPSYSEHYLQFLKLLTSKGMREYMKSKPGFSDKFRRLLLAKREKMMRDMYQQRPAQESVIGQDAVRLQQARQQEINLEERILLEDSLNSITLNCDGFDNQPLPQSSTMGQNGSFLSSFDNDVSPQFDSLSVDIDHVINQELENDLLLDFNFDGLPGDFSCDDDFLSQF